MSTQSKPDSNAFWIDSHAHIYSEEFKEDIDGTLQRARDMNVQKIVMPNIDQISIDAMLEVESRYPGQCFAAMGLHPCSVKKDFQRVLYMIESWLSKRKFAAVGEIGTDLYWDKTFWDEQKEVFTIQIGWAKQYRLPVIIHCRETLNETIALVEKFQDEKLTGVFHCFTGTAAQAKQIASMNFFVGIGGVATFKKGGLDDVLPEVPLDRIILETDSPYLAPAPHRGKRNEPSYIPLIAAKVAEFKKLDPEAVQQQTTGNALQLFGQIS